MAIGNQSGRDVEYEVQPSNPGLTQPIAASILFTVTGGALTAAGCLADGGTGLTVLGLISLGAALISQAVAYGRARALTSAPVSTGKTLLTDGSADDHSFIPGTWVVFYEVGKSNPVAQSPPIYDSGSTVTLRQCPGEGQRLSQGEGTYVEVTPSA